MQQTGSKGCVFTVLRSIQMLLWAPIVINCDAY